MKYILVIGGCSSGIGKGIVTSSLGAILKSCNLKVTAIKIDPYLNRDAGLFSPYEHGEVFVLDDGGEVDLDLGNYERFLDIQLKSKNNITTGKVTQKVFDTERRGDYEGKTVQVIPHLTDAIKDWVQEAANTEEDTDICMIELGGTIGDIEGMAFVEALSQFRFEVGEGNFCCVLLNPILNYGGQQKTKLVQITYKLIGNNLMPDVIICRNKTHITEEVKKKISFYTRVPTKRLFTSPDLESIYQLPNELVNQGIVEALSERLKLTLNPDPELLKKWDTIFRMATNGSQEITIALVGKYTKLRDSYTSVIKSLEHACYHINSKPKILFISAEALEESDKETWSQLKSSQCIIVPGGFGHRGVEGKILATNWARLNKVPFLGVCLGFQAAAIEYARNVVKIENAHSEEFVSKIKNQTPIIIEMLEYKDPEGKLGGTMRLGRRQTKFVQDSILKSLYGDKEIIEERHRHRYEINPVYIENLENNGLKFVGKSIDETRMEIFELDQTVHPYFVGVQYHPEYLSKPFKPSPPYLGLIKAAVGQL